MPEKPPYPYVRTGHCAGCRSPEPRVLTRTGPPHLFRYRCAPCAQSEAKWRADLRVAEIKLEDAR